MVRMGMAVVIGGIVASMVIAMYAYIQYQPNIMEVSNGEPVVVGPVEYSITFEGIHDGNDEVKPEHTFVEIRINMRNIDSSDVTVTGGQFYFVDTGGERHWPIYGNGTFAEEDLYIEVLQPDRSVTRTTQFDVPFDDLEQYQIIIRPAKEHESIDVGIVCITNC